MSDDPQAHEPATDEPAGGVEWFAHSPSLHRESRSIRFHGELGEGDEARTVNVAVAWEALEALEEQQTEVRDRLRYTQLFEAHRERFQAIAERKLTQGDALEKGYLVIRSEDL